MSLQPAESRLPFVLDARVILDSLLHYAAISGWEGTIDLLLDHGADPQQTCVTGETALHLAVSLQHVKAAGVLLDRCPQILNEADKVRLDKSHGCLVPTCGRSSAGTCMLSSPDLSLKTLMRNFGKRIGGTSLPA